MEQDPHLPFFAHYISINAAWAPAKPCGECLLFTSFYDRVLNLWACPPLQSVPPWFWDVISLAPSL